uniref:Laminin G domain-containing protein n=1 Tax=Plectus sambesii TaxID=2011161 RepID=A0A914VBT5_9BILA
MLDSTRVAQPKNVDFAQFRGQIARIKYNSDEGFKCMQSAGVSSTNTNVPVEICKKNSRNFCNCYAPAAAVGNACDNVESLNKEQMFQMRRNPTKSALFYIDDYDQGQALSALFKSDGDSGLVFNTVTGEEPHLRHTQVFYVGRNMTAIVCESRPAEKLDANCITCSIDIYEGFSSYSWHRVSYFKTKGYDYLTVNEQICQLRMAPIENSHHIYTKNSHKISKHNALFVGGYPNTGTRDKALATPLDDYVDNTREKVPSIQGCIGDLFIGGQRRSLVQAYDRQQSIALSASQRGSFEIPIAPSDHSESCSSTGCYLDKLWVVFRPPTGNDNVEKILRFEDIKSSENRSIEIGTSNKGTKVHISTNGLTYDFLLDISDGRSHFVIISRNAAVGTRKHYYSTRIQVDNHHFDIPYIYMSSIDKIEVTQLHESSAKFNNGGCLSDIGISYKRDSDDDSKRHRLEGKIVNIIEQILQNANASNQLRFTNECGLRDNNIWMSPIAPAGFGYLRPYNPRGVGEPVGRLPDGGNKLAWRIILLIILIVLLAIFVFVIAICILVKQRKKRDYDTKRGRTYRKAAELKPLRSLKAVDKDEKVKPIGEISSPYSKPWVPQPHPDRRDPIKRQSSNLEEGFGLSQVDIMQSAEIVRRDSIRLPPLTRLDEVPHIDV